MKLTKEQLVKETASKLNRYLTTHNIFYTTIRAETAFLKQFAKSDRANVTVQKITESFIRKLHSIAIKKSLSAKNRHLLIDAYCVTESLTRYKQDDDEHTHAFLCIHHELEDKLLHRTIRDELDYKTLIRFYNIELLLNLKIRSILFTLQYIQSRANESDFSSIIYFRSH